MTSSHGMPQRMHFHDRAAHARVPAGAAAALRIWLFTIAAFVLLMVVVGGATRLTGSGLSITEWQPILGVVPPLNHEAWMDAFAKYRDIPQFQLVNHGMSLGEFQSIYWWEWAHRLIGRLIGFVFLVPFAVFLWRGDIPRRWIAPVALLFVLGASQGALGWFMVKSGLANRVDVSQYRLAAHLALAVAIGGYAVWLAFSLRDSLPSAASLHGRKHSAGFALAVLLSAAIYAQMIAGAFVAGLKAGYASNTWPLMGDVFVPDGLWALSPWYSNLFENPLTAQFVHRALGYAVAALAIAVAAGAWRRPAGLTARAASSAVVAAIALQIGLGVATVVYDVPLTLALAHQANAMILFALSLWYMYETGRVPDSRGYAEVSARSRSPMISAISSIPTESRTTSSPAPASRR